MRGKVKRILLTICVPVFSVGVLFLVWFLVAKAKGNELILPSPRSVMERFFTLWQEKNFYNSLFLTIGRTFLCFVLSFAFGIVLAVVANMSKPCEKFLSPIVSVLRAAPTVAVIYILYAFMPAKKMAIVVGFLIGFPILYSQFVTALSEVDKNLVTMAKIYKVPILRRIFGIYVPSILPTVFDASRATLSLTLKVVIAAEILTLVPLSLGGKIQSAYSSFEIAYLLAWTLLAIVVSFVLEIMVSVIKKAVVRWK